MALIRVHAGLEFGPAQVETFAPLLPVLRAFADEQGLELSRLFDADPVTPGACYFLSWQHAVCRGCFIRICASDPFHFVEDFKIVTSGWKKPGWDYSVSEGPERLRAILEQAKPQAEQCRKAQQPAV